MKESNHIGAACDHKKKLLLEVATKIRVNSIVRTSILLFDLFLLRVCSKVPKSVSHLGGFYLSPFRLCYLLTAFIYLCNINLCCNLP